MKRKINQLSELGEFGLIDHISKNITPTNKETVKGIGDDAAVLDMGDQQTLITTDMLMEGVHFDLMYTPLKHLGYKAVVVNLSDIYAMNGTPKQITVSMAVSGKFSLQAIEELYEGIHKACEIYNVDLAGGDTTSSMTGLALSITAIGTVERGKSVYRSGAQENDIVCVSGDLGAAYAGLQLLEREKEVFKVNPNSQPELSGNDYILERFLKPEARKDIVAELAMFGVQPTSMMDISDGLSSELIHICTQSETGCRIYEEKLPIQSETAQMMKVLNMEPIIAALNGGEDYELLFTVKPSDFEKISEWKKITPIGHITERKTGMALVTKAGNDITLTAQGWNAYKKQPE